VSELTGIGQRALGQLIQMSGQRWGIGIGVVLVAISGLFGGLNTAPQRPVALNTAIDAGPWKITVTGARLVGDLPPMHLSDKKNYWIVVLATVEITADRTWNILGEAVQLAPTRGIKAEPSKTLAGEQVQLNDGIVLMRDATQIDQLNPGMPEKLAFFWELESTGPIPTEVKVYVGFRRFRQDGLSGHMNWMDDSEHNKVVVVPVIDRREATAASS
jgi:hypothetical protein